MDKARVLIVDDDANLARLVALMLTRAGVYEPRFETRPFMAVETALEFGPDLAILDIDMPGKDGGDLAREFRAHPALRSVPIIFLTALVSRSETSRGAGPAGGAPILAKPVEPMVLMDAIDGALAKRLQK